MAAERPLPDDEELELKVSVWSDLLQAIPSFRILDVWQMAFEANTENPGLLITPMHMIVAWNNRTYNSIEREEEEWLDGLRKEAARLFSAYRIMERAAELASDEDRFFFSTQLYESHAQLCIAVDKAVLHILPTGMKEPGQ
jgi:hypothetical protein